MKELMVKMVTFLVSKNASNMYVNLTTWKGLKYLWVLRAEWDSAAKYKPFLFSALASTIWKPFLRLWSPSTPEKTFKIILDFFNKPIFGKHGHLYIFLQSYYTGMLTVKENFLWLCTHLRGRSFSVEKVRFYKPFAGGILFGKMCGRLTTSDRCQLCLQQPMGKNTSWPKGAIVW